MSPPIRSRLVRLSLLGLVGFLVGCGGEVAQESAAPEDPNLPPGATAVSANSLGENGTARGASSGGSNRGSSQRSGDPAVNPEWLAHLESLGMNAEVAELRAIDNQLLTRQGNRLDQLVLKLKVLIRAMRNAIDTNRLRDANRIDEYVSTVYSQFPATEAEFNAQGANFPFAAIQVGRSLGRIELAFARDDARMLEAAIRESLVHMPIEQIVVLVPKFAERYSDPKFVAFVQKIVDSSPSSQSAAGNGTPSPTFRYPAYTTALTPFNAWSFRDLPIILVYSPNSKVSEEISRSLSRLSIEFEGRFRIITATHESGRRPKSDTFGMLPKNGGVELLSDEGFLESVQIDRNAPAVLLIKNLYEVKSIWTEDSDQDLEPLIKSVLNLTR